MTLADPNHDTRRPLASVGQSDAQVQLAIKRLAGSDCPLLLLGEHGVGKRYTAAQIHARSHRSRESFKEIRCADLDARGMLSVLSARGTVYLVEVADLHLSLQERIVRDYFATESSRNCRLLFGSSGELSDEVKSGRMREDFYYLISGVTLRIPPLRQRRAEILTLTEMLLTQYAKQFDRPKPPLSGEIAYFLIHHPWPGNVNELQTAIKTLVAIGDETISLAALKAAGPGGRPNGHRKSRSLKEATRCVSIQVERQMISEVLGSTGGNRKRAADELGISYKALLYKIKQFGVEPASKESGASL